MTDAELRAEIAIEVMGWEITHRGRRVRRDDGREVTGFRGKADARRWIGYAAPDYPHDMNAAIQVAEKMRERGWWLELDRVADGWQAAFDFGGNWETDAHLGPAGTDPDNPARAICLAALRAIDTERP